MKSMTVTLEERHIERLDELTDEEGRFDNRSEAVRELIDQDSDTERLKTENERLKNEKQKLIAQMEENQELKEYVGEDRRIRREERKRQKAPIWKRLYWTVLGEDDQNILKAANVKRLMPGKKYECEECGGEFPPSQVLHSDERTVCSDCMTVEDRIID